MKTIAFFNNKAGVGKTSLVYHLAWMYADLGLSVVAADFDPQANLTSMCLDEDDLVTLWEERAHAHTVYGALQPLLEGTGDIALPRMVHVGSGLTLLAGDLALSSAAAENELSSQWPACLNGNPRAFRVISALWRILNRAAAETEAHVVLIDVGPTLGALNRAALLAAEEVVIPLAPDLFSLQGLWNLGPTLRDWRNEWQERLDRVPESLKDFPLPTAPMNPTGYVVLQHALRFDQPVRVYGRWMQRIPQEYRQALLGQSGTDEVNVDNDPHCLSNLKHSCSLMPLAQEARKPIFFLKPADGAIGRHMKSVQDCYRDFRTLARRIAERASLAKFPVDTGHVVTYANDP